MWYDPDPVQGSEQAGRRPAVVMSRDAVNRSSPVVVVVPMTTFRGQTLYPSDVLVKPPEGGLRVASVALGLQIRAVDRARLESALGRLGENALLCLLDIDRPDL
ncbi:MAG: type II toxin-antitoxin system PemK/MazF family toxin [Candidatus Eremiobacterota bacterium]